MYTYFLRWDYFTVKSEKGELGYTRLINWWSICRASHIKIYVIEKQKKRKISRIFQILLHALNKRFLYKEKKN